MDTPPSTNEDDLTHNTLHSDTIDPLELPGQGNNEIVILDSDEENEADSDSVEEIKFLDFAEDDDDIGAEENAQIKNLIDIEENKLLEHANQEVQDNVIEIQDDTDDTTLSSKESQLAAASMESVQITRYYYRNEEISLDPNTIVMYCKKLNDIRVVAYKGHEYESLPDKNKEEKTWRCRKSPDCPALLIIGKRGNNKAYEVDEHNCVDAIDTLDQSLLEEGYALVNVLYYEGSNVLDAFFSLDQNLLILFGGNKAFFNTYEYVKTVATKDFFEYGCPFAPCEALLRFSRKGMDKKMVLVTTLHTCTPITHRNQHSVASEVVDLPEKFTGVRLIKYETLQELSFCLKIDQLFPPAGLPKLYFNQELDQKSVYFRRHNYSLSFIVNKRDSEYNIFKCKTKWCSGQLDVTSDYTGVLEVGEHICDNPEDRKICDLYKLIKLSKLSDRDDGEGEVIIIEDEKSRNKPGYVQVTFKYVNNLRDCVTSNDDTETVMVYAGECTQQQVCCYKGYSYRYDSLQLRVCSRSTVCPALLVAREDLSQVKEIGTHICKNSFTEEIPCPALTPILPIATKDNAKAPPDKLDSLHYNLVKIKNYIGRNINTAKLNPTATDVAYVYLDEVGRRPIIYYKGHTYHYYHKSRSIYLCSRSRGCSAALKPHTTNRYELAEVGEHNCNLLSDSNSTVGVEPNSIKFVIFGARDFNLVPSFDPNNHNVVTMLVSDVRNHNIVYYKGYTYVDDRSLSCERGERMTRKSCNLLYMCVKSNKCSAGLNTNIDRTTVLEVGLHSCLNTGELSDNDSNRLFKELKPVSFFHKSNGKPDNLDGYSSNTVITYMENKRKAAIYNGYTYIDRVNCCSSYVGCKCLYMCDKRPDCTASILVDARQAVLEVGLHSCKKNDSSPCQNVVYFIPAMFSAPFFNTPGYGGKSDAIPEDDLTPIIPKGRIRNISKARSEKSKKAKKSLIIINHTKHRLKRVMLEEQKHFVESNNTIKFRGYVHEKSKYSNNHNCIHRLTTNCAGQVVLSDSRIIEAREHICQEIQQDSLPSNYVFIYFNQSLREELLYKRFAYLRNSKHSLVWVCAKYPHCKSSIKFQEDTIQELCAHTCTSSLLKEILNMPLTAISSRLTDIIGHQQCCPPTVPVLNEKDQLCLIHLGYIYAYTSHKKDTLNDTVLSEWTCIQVMCLAVLCLKGDKVAEVSEHHCFVESPQNHIDNSTSTDDELCPVQEFQSDRSTYLMRSGYIYQHKGLNSLTKNYTLKCMNSETDDCWGTLLMQDNQPIVVSKHSCRNLIPAGDFVVNDEMNECDDIIIKEEEILEEDTDVADLMDSEETSGIAEDNNDTYLNNFYTSHQSEFTITDVTGGCEMVDEDPTNIIDDQDSEPVVINYFNPDDELDVENAIPATVVMVRKNPS